jgi:hypothetical protein
MTMRIGRIAEADITGITPLQGACSLNALPPCRMLEPSLLAHFSIQF